MQSRRLSSQVSLQAASWLQHLFGGRNPWFGPVALELLQQSRCDWRRAQGCMSVIFWSNVSFSFFFFSQTLVLLFAFVHGMICQRLRGDLHCLVHGACRDAVLGWRRWRLYIKNLQIQRFRPEANHNIQKHVQTHYFLSDWACKRGAHNTHQPATLGNQAHIETFFHYYHTSQRNWMMSDSVSTPLGTLSLLVIYTWWSRFLFTVSVKGQWKKKYLCRNRTASRRVALSEQNAIAWNDFFAKN